MQIVRRSRHETKLFHFIVQALWHVPNMDFRASCMTFINTLVNHTDLEHRVLLRDDFLAANLLPVARAIEDSILNTAEMESRPISRSIESTDRLPWEIISDIESQQIFQTQLEVFKGMMQADREETTVSRVNLSNPLAIFSKLMTDVRRIGHTEEFLHVLQYMLTLPFVADEITALAWRKLEDAVHTVCTTASIGLSKTHIDALRQVRQSYDSVKELIIRREELSLQLERIHEMEGLITKQKEQIATIESQKEKIISDIQQECNQLQEQLTQMHQSLRNTQQEKERWEKEKLELSQQISKLKANPPIAPQPSSPPPSTSIPVQISQPSTNQLPGLPPAPGTLPNPNVPSPPPFPPGVTPIIDRPQTQNLIKSTGPGCRFHKFFPFLSFY